MAAMTHEPSFTVVVRGTGSIGMRHLNALRALGHRAIAVPVREGRDVQLSRNGVETAVSLRDAVERGATAAIVATDTGRHLADAADALDAGCDVLVEKPLAPSAAGLTELGRRAQDAGRRVFVAYCLRFDEGLLRFRALLPKVGQCHAVRIACQSFLPDWRPGTDYRDSYSARADEGGVLRDLSHEIDYAVSLFGMPEEVTATLSSASRLGIAAEEAADLWWRAADGPLVSIRLDYLTRAARRRILAQGANGEIEWDALAGTVRLALVGSAPQIIPFATDRDGMMQRQARAFLSATHGGASTMLCTFVEATNVVAICDAARRSSITKRTEVIGGGLD